MPRKIDWPESATVRISEFNAAYPGELTTESIYTTQRNTLRHSRKLYHGSAVLGWRRDEADAQPIEAFGHAITAGDTYFDLPIHRDGFAVDGASVGTGNTDGDIEVATVTATGFTLKQRRSGAAADAVNGNLVRDPKAGDYFKIGDRIFQFGSRLSIAEEDNPEYALDSEQLSLIEVGDKIVAADTIRARLAGDPPSSVRGTGRSRRWQAWNFSWMEYVPPVDISEDDAPQLIGSVPEISGEVGDTPSIQLRRTWTNAAGNNTDADLSWEYEIIGDDATGSIAGSKITLNLIRRGFVVVRAWARDVRTGLLSAPIGILVTIRGLGEATPPAVAHSIPLMSLTVGGDPAHINKKAQFGNVEGLTYRVTIEDPTIARLSEEGDIATVSGSRVGVTRGYLIGVSPTGGAQLIIWEIVVAANLTGAAGADGPITGAIRSLSDFPDVTLQATEDDANPRYIRLLVTEYVEVTNGPATYTPVDVIDSDTNQKITTSRMVGNHLRIDSRKVSDLTGSYPLTSTVNLLVRDAAGKERTFTINVTVTAAGNQAPVWQGNKRIILGTTANSRTVTFDLKSATSGYAYAYDPDDGEEVTVTITGTGLGSSDVTKFTATLVGSMLTVTRVLANGQSYEGTLTVRATDDNAVPLSTDFVFDVHIWSTVEPSVTASSWDASELPAQPWNIPFNAPADHALRSVDVTDALTSGDSTPSVVSNNTSVVRASFTGKVLSLRPVGFGPFTLTLSVQSAADDQPVTLTINGTISGRGFVTLGTWNGPGANVLNGVVGNTFDIYPDDYYQVPADAQAQGVKVGYTARIARGDTAYASLDKSSISNSAVGRENRKFVLSYDDATPVGETVLIYIYAIYSKINRNNVVHTARFTVSAAATPPPADAGPVVTQLPNLPAAGAVLYADDTFDVDFSEGFSAGPTGVAINWSTLDVEITGAQRAMLSQGSGSPIRTFTCIGSTTLPVTVRARVQDRNGIWSEYNSFTVNISATPVAARPQWVDRVIRITVPKTPNQHDVALNTLCSYSGTGGLSAIRFGVINTSPPNGNYAFVGNGTNNPRFRIFRGSQPSIVVRFVLTATVAANTRIYRPKAITAVFDF